MCHLKNQIQNSVANLLNARYFKGKEVSIHTFNEKWTVSLSRKSSSKIEQSKT